jgi:tetratricopeptide (TPR) repeat protein
MSGLKRLIHEIHRRSLWQVLLIYIGAAWACYELIDTITERFGLPEWLPALAVILFLLGLPFVVATAFVQEGLGGGAARPKRAATPEPETAEAVPPMREVPEAEVHGVTHRVFTWRNAVWGVVGVVVLLATSAGGFMGLRAAGIGPFGTLITRGVLEERDRIVLADFQDHTGDSTLALALTLAFRTDLEQSPVVRIAQREYVAQVLQRMEKDPDRLLDYELAREVAIREGLKAVVAGEITAVGTGFVLSARLIAAGTGEALASHRETAEDLDAIIPAIDRLSKRLRERIGESYKAIGSSPPLHRVTTASLEALRLYSQASEANTRGEYSQAVALSSRAIELDTLFAMAYAARGIYLLNTGVAPARSAADFARAYELRDRLPLFERYRIEADYYASVAEVDSAIHAYRMAFEVRPELPLLNNIGWLYRDELRDYARAEEVFRQVLELDSLRGITWDNLSHAQFNQGKYEEAEESLRRLGRLPQQYTGLPLLLSNLASARGDYAAAERHVRTFREAQIGSLYWRGRTSRQLAYLAQVRGRLGETDRHLRAAMAVEEERGLPAQYLCRAIDLAQLDLLFRGGANRALQIVEGGLDRYPLDSIPPLDRPYLDRFHWSEPHTGLVSFRALAGQPERARALLTEFERVIDPEWRRRQEPYLQRARGLVALVEDRSRDAISELRRSDRGGCRVCALPYLGRAYDLAGEADSAIAIYERYVETPDLYRLYVDSRHLGPVLERIGSLHEQRGDTAKAVYYYGRLVELWQDADPELQPRVEAARRAIEALSPDR